MNILRKILFIFGIIIVFITAHLMLLYETNKNEEIGKDY